MALEVAYPFTLPNPSKLSWKVKDRARSAGLPGRAFYAALERDFSGSLEVEFYLDSEQAAIWYSWWQVDLKEGAYWFSATWPKVMAGLGVYSLQDPPVFTHVGGGAYSVACKLQVRGKSRPVYAPQGDIYYNSVPGDPAMANVVLLCHADGQNLSSQILDSSPQNRSLSAANNARISTDRQVFGTGSLLLGGTNDYVVAAASSDFDFGTGDFTIEARVFLLGDSPVGTGGARTASVISTDPRSTGWALQINGSSSLTGTNFTFETSLAGASANVAADASGIPQNTWVSLAVTRQGSTVRLFLDGELVKTGSISQDVSSGGNVLTIGANNAESSYFYPLNGHVEEVRVTKGLARYTESYSLARVAFPGVTPERTVLLLHGDAYALAGDPYQAYVASAVLFNDADGSTSAAPRLGPAFNRYGNALVTSSRQHFGNNTYENSTTDSASSFRTAGVLTIPAAADFTLEGWAYLTGSGGLRHAFQFGSVVTNRTAVFVSGGVLYGYLESPGGISSVTSSVGFPAGTWVHLAISKVGGSLYLFQNGLLVGTGSAVSNALAATSSAILAVGTQNYSPAGGDEWIGSLDDVRLTVGLGRYTPESLPDLLPLRFSAVLLDSSSVPKNVVSIDDVAQNYLTKKFGTSSVSLNGSTQYLTFSPLQDLQTTSRDYLVETWVYPTNYGTQHRPVYAVSGANSAGFAFSAITLSASGHLLCVHQPDVFGSAVIAESDTTVTLNAWTHIAVARVGVNLLLFLNGELCGGSSGWSDYPVGNLSYAGVGALPNGYSNATFGRFSGFIDDLRVTRGATRYLQAFRPPVSQFSADVADDPDFASVVLLCSFNGPNGSESLVDASQYARVATVVNNIAGSVSLDSANRRFGGTSLGVHNLTSGAWYASWPADSAFNLNDGDFTVEAWAYNSTIIGSGRSLLSRRLVGAASGWVMTTHSFRAKVNGVWSDTALSWALPSDDVWHHHALVRSGSTLTAFLDGVIVACRSDVATIDDLNLPLRLGQADNVDENRFYGFIDDLRWTKGVARYHGSFQLPVRAYPDY